MSLRSHKSTVLGVLGVVAATLIGARAGAQIYYVSPQGNDANEGTIDRPLKTIQRALSLVPVGGSVYLREGVYANSTTVRSSRSGMEGQYIRLWAFPGETPVLDFSSQPRSSSSRGLQISHNYWYIRGLKIGHAGDNGIHVSGSRNIIEGCVLYENEDTGVQISGGGSFNVIRNCDSYANYDSATHGENADGFAPKLDVGPGNLFVGCRAFDNADDGWDFFESAYQVVLDSCWSFHNGFNIRNDPGFQGDGNGFKVGGNFVPASHRLTRCVAFDNKAKGFDQNNNTAGVTIYNCTAWRNQRNFVFGTVPTVGRDTLINNISWASSVQIENLALVAANSWNGYAVSDADFLSLDTALARSPRNPDGSLPTVDFLRLSPGSSLIDAGVGVGLPYNGRAPDLGAFEDGTVAALAEGASAASSFALRQNYPNPFNAATTIQFAIAGRHLTVVKVYDVLGGEVSTLVNDVLEPGMYTVYFDGSKLASGVYVYRLKSGTSVQAKKLMLLR